MPSEYESSLDRGQCLVRTLLPSQASVSSWPTLKLLLYSIVWYWRRRPTYIMHWQINTTQNFTVSTGLPTSQFDYSTILLSITLKIRCKPCTSKSTYHPDKRRASSVPCLYFLMLQEQNCQNAFITATGTRALALLMLFIARWQLFIALSLRMCMCNASCETAGGVT